MKLLSCSPAVFTSQEILLVLISVRGCHLQGHDVAEELSHWKSSMMPSGIEPATFQLVKLCPLKVRNTIFNHSNWQALQCDFYWHEGTETWMESATSIFGTRLFCPEDIGGRLLWNIYTFLPNCTSARIPNLKWCTAYHTPTHTHKHTHRIYTGCLFFKVYNFWETWIRRLNWTELNWTELNWTEQA